MKAGKPLEVCLATCSWSAASIARYHSARSCYCVLSENGADPVTGCVYKFSDCVVQAVERDASKSALHIATHHSCFLPRAVRNRTAPNLLPRHSVGQSDPIDHALLSTATHGSIHLGEVPVRRLLFEEVCAGKQDATSVTETATKEQA